MNIEQFPLVSVIISNFNYGEFLQEAVESALKQTYFSLEVIVVDDGSTDNSRDIIAGYGDSIIAVCQENKGQSSAINAGFAASSGDIICLLDADDLFLPHKVEEVVKVFASDAEIGWCYHSLGLVDGVMGTIQGATRLFPEDAQRGKSRKCDFRAQLRVGRLSGLYPPPTSGLCFKRSVLDQVLPMPTGFLKTAADSYIRLAGLSIQAGFALDKILSIQRVHGRNSATSFRYISSSPRQKLKGIPVAFWLRTNFPHIGKAADRLFAKGLYSFWRHLPNDSSYQLLVQNYFAQLNVLEKIRVYLFAIYYSLPFRLRYRHVEIATEVNGTVVNQGSVGPVRVDGDND